MKNIFYLLLFFITQTKLAGQDLKQYIIVEPDSSYFKMYSLKNQDQIFKNTEITVINIIGEECKRRKDECLTGIYYTPIEFEGDYLITLSILPDNLQQKTEWNQIIDIDTIKEKILQYDAIVKMAYTEIKKYKNKIIKDEETFWINQRFDIIPIVKKGKYYYATMQNVMTNFYKIESKTTFFPVENDAVSICYNSQKYSKDFILNVSSKTILLDNYGKSQWRPEFTLRDRLYLTTFQRETKLFWFWYYPMKMFDFGCSDGLSEFIFSFEKGIVGATYECYIKSIVEKSKISSYEQIKFPMFAIDSF